MTDQGVKKTEKQQCRDRGHSQCHPSIPNTTCLIRRLPADPGDVGWDQPAPHLRPRGLYRNGARTPRARQLFWCRVAAQDRHYDTP